MTTQVVVGGGGLIPYVPDIVDQYFEKPAPLATIAVLKARFRRQSEDCVAPSVLFNARAIFPAGVFFRASVFNVRTCSDVHARRVPFVLDIVSPSGQSAAF